MPDPSELIFPDEPDFLPNETFLPPPPTPVPRPPMRPPTPPLCSISGIVQNRFGFPLARARVALYTAASGSFRPIGETRTDRFGRYIFRQVRPGQYTLVATGRNRSERKNVSVTPRRCRVSGVNFNL